MSSSSAREEHTDRMPGTLQSASESQAEAGRMQSAEGAVIQVHLPLWGGAGGASGMSASRTGRKRQEKAGVRVHQV